MYIGCSDLYQAHTISTEKNKWYEMVPLGTVNKVHYRQKIESNCKGRRSGGGGSKGTFCNLIYFLECAPFLETALLDSRFLEPAPQDNCSASLFFLSASQMYHAIVLHLTRKFCKKSNLYKLPNQFLKETMLCWYLSHVDHHENFINTQGAKIS